MARGVCRLRVAAPVRRAGKLRLEAELTVGNLSARPIWFELETPDERMPERSARPFVLASLVAAMRAGLPIEADAPLDEVSRRQLQLWQECFVGWRPRLMSRVDIRAPAGAAATPAAGAVTAFSGGADSHYTLLRSAEEGIPLRAGAMVHGFDIPLADREAFERSFARAAGLLRGRGLAAHRIATNARSLDRVFHLSWQHETHGPYLAAALACLEPWYGLAVIPSSYGHAHPVLPWASNALTDFLLGSSGQAILHHGGETMRIDKLFALATDPAFADLTRVCYLNEDKSANCGRCYKCAMAQAVLWISGVPDPRAFPVRATAADIAGQDLPHPTYRHTYTVLAERAERAGLAEIAAAFRAGLARNPDVRDAWSRRALEWLRRLPMR